jgi:hypothetical protein
MKDHTLVHLLSVGEPSEGATAFKEALALPSGTEVLLIDRSNAIGPLDRAVPSILLNADRAELPGILDTHPLSAAIEKYALFMWFAHRKTSGGWWIHGSTDVATRLGPDIELSPLYRTPRHCALGSSRSALPELLVRYLVAGRSA